MFYFFNTFLFSRKDMSVSICSLLILKDLSRLVRTSLQYSSVLNTILFTVSLLRFSLRPVSLIPAPSAVDVMTCAILSSGTRRPKKAVNRECENL